MQLMPYFVMDELKMFPGIPGLFVACVFSAALSTLSSGFNALATVTWDDFLRKTSLADNSEWKINLYCKIIGAIYGVLSVLMAFVVGLIGSVLQAAISLAGALIGPLFGLYMLALLCPFANAKGVIIGLVTGQTFTLWILIGSIRYPKAPATYPTFTDRCLTSNFTLPEPASVAEHNLYGIFSLYHVAFLLVPIIGFIVSLVIGTLASFLTGGTKKIVDVNPRHLSAIAWFIWPVSYLPSKSRMYNVHLRKISDGIISTMSDGRYHSQSNRTLHTTDGQIATSL